jgi:hypothetical protein
LECADIRSGFVAGRVPAGPDVEEHLKWCPHCRELFEKGAQLGRRLAQAVLPEVEPGDLFALVDREVRQDVGLRARLRALPTPRRVSALLAVAVSLALWHVIMRPRPDYGGLHPSYSTAFFWGLLGALSFVFLLGALHLLRGASAPLRSPAWERGFALSLLFAPALLLLLAPLGTSSPEMLAAWAKPAICFTYGGALALPIVFLYWLFERRDRVPWTSLVSAGALAGIAANLMLHAHCPSEHLGHLLVGHASIGVAWALALGLLSRQFQRSG